MGLKLPWDRIKADNAAEDHARHMQLHIQDAREAVLKKAAALQATSHITGGSGGSSLGSILGSALQNQAQAQQQYQSIMSQIRTRRTPSAPDGRMLIGLVGHSGVGKSTVAHHLRANWEFQVSAFAEPIKSMLSSLATVPDIRDKDAEIIPGVTLREAMEATGNALRGLDKDFLVHHWKQTHCHMPSATPGTVAPFMVIDDVRFEAEARMIRKMGGKLIRVINPSVDFGKIAAKEELNPCEIEIGDIEYDAAIYNKGSREDLVASVDKVLEGWGLSIAEYDVNRDEYTDQGVIAQQLYVAAPPPGSVPGFGITAAHGGKGTTTIGGQNWRQNAAGQWETY